jgi:hypothetical protein
MTHLEMVEKLRAVVGLSYEEAKEVLERNDWDLLGAMIDLEKEGKVHGASCSTLDKDVPAVETPTPKKQGSFKGALRWLWELLKKSCNNDLEATRHGARILGLPILVMIVLLCVCFWVVVPVMIVSLLCGVRYRFVGPDIGHDTLNDLKDKVINKVDDALKDDQ